LNVGHSAAWEKLRLAQIAIRLKVTREEHAILDGVIWTDPERVGGEPCFKRTRVPVQALIDHIEGDRTLEDFLKGFPSVTRIQAVRFIELARDNPLACISS